MTDRAMSSTMALEADCSSSTLNSRPGTTCANQASVAIAFIFSWASGAAAVVVEAPFPILHTILTMVSGFGPSLAGVAVVACNSPGPAFRRWIRHSLNWRIGWRAAFCLPPAIGSVALAICSGSGGLVPTLPAAGHIPLAIADSGRVLFIGGPPGEEFGGRGYAMPALADRLNWRAASLVAGAFWGIWHLPRFFTVGTAQTAMPMPVFLVNSLAGSVLFGWHFERAQGSVLPARVLHTSRNAWVGIRGSGPTAAAGRPYALATGLLVLIAAVLLFVGDTEPTGETPDIGSWVSP